MSITSVTRTAGVAGSFEVTFSQAPVAAPTLTIYSDLARTVVAVASQTLSATASPVVWVAAYPAFLAFGSYFLSVSAVYTSGQPAKVNGDDTLLLTDPGVVVATRAVTLAEAKAFLPDPPATADLLLQMLIDAAEDLVADYVGCPLVPTVLTERHSEADTIVLRKSHVIGAATLVSANGTIVTGYVATSDGLLVRSGVYGYGLLTVTYTAGFSPLPTAVRLAILYTVQHAYESQQGSTPTGFGSVDESFVNSRGFAVPNRAKEYLAPYRHGQRVA